MHQYANMNVKRQSCYYYHCPLLLLQLLLPSPSHFRPASAFVVSNNSARHNIVHSVKNAHAHASESEALALAFDDGTILSQCSLAQKSNTKCKGSVSLIDDFNLSTILRRCVNLSLMMFVASVAIAFPSPSAAKFEQPTLVPAWSSSVVMTTADLSSINPSSISELGLKPPTEEKPQIMLNGKAMGPPTQQTTLSQKSNAREPILQGLVYFPERAPTDPAVKSPAGPQVKQQLDYYSDILVLTAVPATQPNGPIILAGAKFPVSSVRFPFSFQMYKENLLSNKPGVTEAWEGLAKTEDVILRAQICPSDASKLPCEEGETKKYAEGVAKLVTNLPGLPEGEVIRAPASLALQ